jgi:hypothetical protein
MAPCSGGLETCTRAATPRGWIYGPGKEATTWAAAWQAMALDVVDKALLIARGQDVAASAMWSRHRAIEPSDKCIMVSRMHVWRRRRRKGHEGPRGQAQGVLEGREVGWRSRCRRRRWEERRTRPLEEVVAREQAWRMQGWRSAGWACDRQTRRPQTAAADDTPLASPALWTAGVEGATRLPCTRPAAGTAAGWSPPSPVPSHVRALLRYSPLRFGRYRRRPTRHVAGRTGRRRPRTAPARVAMPGRHRGTVN